MNGSDKGYVDLFLMAHCDAIISSIGSLGDFAAVLSFKKPTLYLSYFKESALSVGNSIYINPYMPKQYLNAVVLKSQQHRRTGLCKIRYKLFRHFEKIVQGPEFLKSQQYRRTGLYKIPYKLFRHFEKCVRKSEA